MAGPITWRNVDAPSNRDVMTGLALAGNSFGNAGDVFSKVIADRQAANQGAINEQNEMAKQAYLDLVATAKTPEAVAALEASGRLEQLRRNMTPGNLAATRGATEARTLGNQQMIEAGNKFQTSQTEFANKTPFDQAMAAANAGDTAAVQAALAANPDMPNKAKIQEALFKSSTQATQTGIAQSKEAREVAEAPITAALRKAQTEAAIASTAYTNAQAANIPVETADKARDRATRSFDRISTEIAADQEKLNKLDTKAIGGKEGVGGIITNLAKVVEDKSQLGKISEYLGTALTNNPEFRKLPTSVVESIALKHANNTGWLGMGGSNANDIIRDMTAALADPANSSSGNDAARAGLIASIKQRQLVADGLMREANPALAAQLDKAAAKAAEVRAAVVAPAATPETPVDRPVETPGSKARAEESLLAERAALEQQEMAAGLRKKLSPEAKKYVEGQSERDKEALANGVRSAGSVFDNINAAGLDLVTIPSRGVIGAANSVIRGTNALGANLPFIPVQGDGTSLTPYTDSLRAKRDGDTAIQDLKAQREAFDKKVAKELGAKKAK